MKTKTQLFSRLFILLATLVGLVVACAGEPASATDPEGCPTGLADCSGMCVQTAVDPANCGACGTACASGEVCSAGTCGIECLGGSTKCGNLCVDTNWDVSNCGSCSNACASGEVCSAGTCGFTCVGGATECGDKCVDTVNDPANCGACGTACAAGEVCSAGTCAVECLGGATKCGSSCVDTANDPAHCGACDNACMSGEVCSNSACALQCSGGTTKCGSSCVNTTNDPAHCGGCNTPCPVNANQVPVCTQSQCSAPCAVGYNDCDAQAANGCEVQGACSTGGVFAFGEFRPAMTCGDFKNNGPSYQKYCFDLKGKTYCTGQHASGNAQCTDTANGVKFVYDWAQTWPMRFTQNDQQCQNYHPTYIENFANAIGYANWNILQQKTGNSCTRTWLDTNGAFQQTSGDSNQSQIYEIEYW